MKQTATSTHFIFLLKWDRKLYSYYDFNTHCLSFCTFVLDVLWHISILLPISILVFIIPGCCRFIEIHICIVNWISGCFPYHCCGDLNFQAHKWRHWDAKTLPNHYWCCFSFWSIHCNSCGDVSLHLSLQWYENIWNLFIGLGSLVLMFLFRIDLFLSCLRICMKKGWGLLTTFSISITSFHFQLIWKETTRVNFVWVKKIKFHIILVISGCASVRTENTEFCYFNSKHCQLWQKFQLCGKMTWL